MQQSELNRFITAFKNVVCAPNEEQIRALWNSAIEGGQFPLESVECVKKQYYESPKARQIMECYVYDCGNLCQTTTSRNEGSHAAYRSKANIIPNPAESYKLRRLHKQQWMQRLRSAAMNARNRIPVDIQCMPELCHLAGKLSLFAVTEIQRQIILAKKEETEARGSLQWVDSCTCHAHRRYGLPCKHMVPTDGIAMPLEDIAPFWRLDNWEQGCIATRMIMLITRTHH